jgi:hypothetical protein
MQGTLVALTVLLDCLNSCLLMFLTVPVLMLTRVAAAQPEPNASTTRLVARIEVQKNTNVSVDEQVEVVLPTSESSVVASWGRFNHVHSLKWPIIHQLGSISVDGSARNVTSVDRDDQTTVTILEAGTYAPGTHLIHIAYTSSGKFTADGDDYAPGGHNYHLRMGVGIIGALSSASSRVQDIPVEAARVVLVLRPRSRWAMWSFVQPHAGLRRNRSVIARLTRLPPNTASLSKPQAQVRRSSKCIFRHRA